MADINNDAKTTNEKNIKFLENNEEGIESS